MADLAESAIERTLMLMQEVVHITAWLSRTGGGIPPVVFHLAEAQRRLGLRPTVSGLADRYTQTDTGRWVERFPVLGNKVKGPRKLGYAPHYARDLDRFCRAAQVAHLHGLWMYPNAVAGRWARANGRPLLVSPHGMLDSWALGRSAWKKRVAASLFEDTNLRSAACIHALCESEAESIRAYGLSNPIAVLPNGVDVTSFASLPACDALWQRFPELRDKKVILFLGRLHPKKGPLHLIEGWSRVAGSFPDWHLLISGPDEIGHQAVLEDTSKARGIANRITFAGAVVGRDKLAALAAADVFVLPSLSEGFSVALLEAMACRLPAIITPPCNFPEAIAAGAAIEVQPDAESTAAGLVHVMEMSGAARRQCGLRGYELVAANYTWEGIAQEMTDVYSWCLGGGSPPKAIRLN